MNAPTRWADALIGAAASWAVLLPVQTLLESGEWVLPAVLVSAAVVGAGIVARGFLRHWAAVLAVQLAVGLESIVLLHGRGHTFYGLPKWETVVALNNVLIEARETIMRSAAPAPANRGMIVALSILACLIVVVVDLLAVTRRAPAVAGLALVTAYLVTAANSGEPLFFVYFLLPAVLWLIMLARTGTGGLRRWATVLPRAGLGQQPNKDPRRAFAQTAGVMGGVVLVSALVLPGVIPHLQTRYLTDGLGRSTDSVGNGTFSLSTTLDLKANLESQSTTPALKYRTSISNPGPLRVAVLTDYNDRGEFRQRQQYPARAIGPTVALQSVEALQRWRATGTDLPPGSLAEGVFSAYESDLLDPQIALPYGSRFLRVDDQIRATEFREGTVEVYERARSYEVDFTVLDLTPSMLQNAPSWSSQTGPLETRGFASDTVIPATLEVDPRAVPALDTVLGEIAEDADTDLEKAVAIQDWLRSPAFTYSLELIPVPRGGNAPDPITHFLQTRVGYCQQFATAMIMLARQSGVPARMAIGFLPGSAEQGEYTVLRSGAHAWPELYFAPYGWVRFDPTPGTRSGNSPVWARTPSTTPTSSASSANPVASPTSSARSRDQLDPQNLDTGSGSTWTRVQRMPTSVWVAVALLAGLLAALVLPVTSALARRRRLTKPGQEAEHVEACWQDLISRLGDLGITTPGTLTPRQVHGYLTDTAVLDHDTAAALGRVVGVVEVARYAPPGSDLADPGSDIAKVYDSVDATRPSRARVRARLAPYAGRAALQTLRRRVSALPGRLTRELRHRGD